MKQAGLAEMVDEVIAKARGGGGEPPPVDPPPIPGDDGRMEGRLTAIERDIAVIKTQMESFAKHYATKADVIEAKNSIIMWVVGAIFIAQLLPPILKLFGK